VLAQSHSVVQHAPPDAERDGSQRQGSQRQGLQEQSLAQQRGVVLSDMVGSSV